MKKLTKKIIILFLLISFCGESAKTIEESDGVVEYTTTSTLNSSSTTQTTNVELKASSDSSERRYRGVLRTSTLQSVPLVYDFKDYTEKVVKPNHEYVEYFVYSIRIPVFFDSQKCSTEINNFIESSVNNLIEDTKSVLEFTNPEEAEEEWGGFYESLSIDYDVIEVSDEVISVFLSYSTYSFGAAHPISAIIGFNYFIEDCSKLEIQKLFDSSNLNYETIISSEMQNQLCANLENNEECETFLSFIDPFPLLTELLDCCSAFAVSEYGLFVQFWEYEVSSYSEGAELILLPWHDLVPALDADGPYINTLVSYSKKSWTESIFEPAWEISK